MGRRHQKEKAPKSFLTAHLGAHPELLTQEVLVQLQSFDALKPERRGTDKFIRQSIDVLLIPNSMRQSKDQLYKLVGDARHRIAWKLLIEQAGITVGGLVKRPEWTEPGQVISITASFCLAVQCEGRTKTYSSIDFVVVGEIPVEEPWKADLALVSTGDLSARAFLDKYPSQQVAHLGSEGGGL